MKTCGDDCQIACDFCKHYDFNGEPIVGTDGRVVMAYTGQGRCLLRDEQMEPGDHCEQFHCECAKD